MEILNNLQRIIISEKEILNFIINNNVIFIVVSTILIIKIKAMATKNILFASLIHIIGTLLHELSHYIVALVTTLKIPSNFSILPKSRIENGIKTIELGYVVVNKKNLNIFNSFLIGMSPLSLLFAAYYVSKNFFTFYEKYFSVGVIAYILYVFLIVTLVVNSVPSKADFEMARYKGSIYLYLLISSFLIYLYILK